MRKSIRSLTALVLLALTFSAAAALAAVENVPVGIRFTYTAPGAGRVTLAGTLNDWDAERNPLTDDGKGNWSIVMALKPGQYEYKFVVDGSWFADPDNPDTMADPYGGANSLIQVGDDGKMVAVAREEKPAGGPNTTFNARVTMDGRYLSRFTAYKGYDGDPRYRMHRPEQNIDLNFHTEINDVVDAYTRLRLDNTTTIDMNDVGAQLDEGALDVHPDVFHVLGYWDMEQLGLDDPLSSGGDLDLEGTILDDHLPSGKGTAGVVVTGTPFGCDFRGFFADVHDANWYNDIEIYDNTGRDVFGARLSHDFGGVTVGVPLYMERELIWVDMSSYVGTPDDTGIPALDRHLAETNDSSTWFEWDNMDMSTGLDLTIPLLADRGRLQLEWLYSDVGQGLVTGDNAGFNDANGPVDIDMLDRTRQVLHGSFDVTLREGRSVNMEHTAVLESGAGTDETLGSVHFLHQDEADQKVYLSFSDAPAEMDTYYSEVTLRETVDDRRHVLWVQHRRIEADYAAAGLVSPVTGRPTASGTIWTLSGLNAIGTPASRFGAFELENAIIHYDDQVNDLDGHTFESILRWERRLSRRLSGVADLRYIDYQMREGEQYLDDGFFAPWFGVRYQPSPKLDVTLAYGLDPLAFGIDYEGRQNGRWRYRQQYVYDYNNEHEDEATEFDAERALDELRAIGVRANFRF